jgi:uncharacterized protein YndB with AHSA1/START domain
MGDRVSKGRTSVTQNSERELVVTRTFDAPVRLVFDAWTKAELFQLWWAPRSRNMPMQSCEMDVRTGGGYRIVFAIDASRTMTFHGKYLEVAPLERLVWTNEESGDQGAVTTVTFEEDDGQTRLVLRELYPTKALFEESYVGMEDTMPEQFEQLDELLLTLGASA